MTMSGLCCEVCKQPAIGVCSSSVGAISLAFCQDCLEAGREPWEVLVGGLFGCTRDNIHESAKQTVAAACQFYRKTEDDFWNDVAALEKQLEEYSAAEEAARKGLDQTDVGK